VLGGLGEYEKCAAKIGGNDLVESIDIVFGDRRQRHDAGVVHNDVNLTVGHERLVEELFDVVGVCDVSLDGDGTGPPALTISLTVSSALAALPAKLTTTPNPSAASRRAMERPIPREAPVTMAVFLMEVSPFGATVDRWLSLKQE
jgi:hypothetical protein